MAVTVVLAIAVVVLAAGLLYALASRPREPQVDLDSTIQEATSQAVAAALPGLLPGLLQANDEARKVDAKTAEVTIPVEALPSGPHAFAVLASGTFLVGRNP